MLNAIYSTQFRKDYKLCQKRGYVMQNLTEVMLDLEVETPLQPKHKVHPLQGEYKGCLECHIAPDWLLVYEIDHGILVLILTSTGTHSGCYTYF